MADSSGGRLPPDEAHVPLPAFPADAGSASSSKGDVAEGPGQSIVRCARILRTSPPEEVEAFLEEVAGLMLGIGGRDVRLTYLGGQLSQQARSFLAARKIGMKGVLACYGDDFHLTGAGPQLSATYLWDAVNRDWRMSYSVEVTL
eukprot:TRINITY_DN4348_c0_g1_i2.p1 TRINITY_DN4348_c0_g1~~TRINITY_DN4348_c0_g1_i2.p1  ORF type:complete len:169 (+),score=10.78 TRINITY_DN4348_c0_g1_i2:75-509(+)